jgi:hypothetical protein
MKSIQYPPEFSPGDGPAWSLPFVLREFILKAPSWLAVGKSGIALAIHDALDTSADAGPLVLQNEQHEALLEAARQQATGQMTARFARYFLGVMHAIEVAATPRQINPAAVTKAQVAEALEEIAKLRIG